MADQTQRLEIATVRAEVGSNIVYRFANDAANEGGIPTDSGNIQNLKQVIVEIQADAAEKISIATTIYQTPAAGLAATADGGIFLVQSSDADTIYTVWKNQAGTAVNTGKTAMSSQAVQDALNASNEAAQAAEDAADVATNRTAGFLQPSAEAPVVRDNGLPLQVGDRYFNTEDQAEYLYKAEGWTANDSLEAISLLEQSISPTPGAGKIPRADENGFVSGDWIPSSLARLSDLANGVDPSRGAGLLSFNAGFSSSIGRSLTGKLNDWVSVKDFGAIGDGTAHTVQEWIIPSARGWASSLAEVQAKFPHVSALTDYIDWAAWQAAVKYVLSLSTAKLIMAPAGVYLLNRSIIAAESIAVMGHGIEQTRIIWDGTSVSQGFDVSFTSTRGTAHPSFVGMDLVRKGAYGGTAISINGATGGGYPDIFRATIQNLRMSRFDRAFGVGSWSVGIHATNIAGCNIDNVTFQGDSSPTVANGVYGTFLWVDGPDGISEVNSHFFLNSTFCTTAEYAVRASNCEEIHINNFAYFNVDYGVVYDNTGNYDPLVVSPRVEINNGHIKGNKKGVYFRKAQAGGVTGIYFLHDKNSSPAGTSYKHVQLDGCLNTTVRDLKVEGINGSVATGIELINSSYDNVVESNSFFTTGSDAVHLDSTSQSNYIGINYFRSAGWARYIFNESAFAMLTNGVISVKNDANVSFPNGSLVIPFTSVFRNDLGSGFVDLVGQPARLTIAKRGKYVLSAHTQITANASGIRTINIRVNGASPIGSGRITVPAPPTGNSFLSVKSDTIILNAGDYITLYVEQTSGQTLEVVLNSVLSAEFICTC